VLSFPVEFTLKLVHEDLLLLADGDRCGALELFDFVDLNFGKRNGFLDGAEFFREPFLGEVGVVSLFPVPVSFVPDAANTLFFHHSSRTLN
jgi:hypothetical protein